MQLSLHFDYAAFAFKTYIQKGPSFYSKRIKNLSLSMMEVAYLSYHCSGIAAQRSYTRYSQDQQPTTNIQRQIWINWFSTLNNRKTNDGRCSFYYMHDSRNHVFILSQIFMQNARNLRLKVFTATLSTSVIRSIEIRALTGVSIVKFLQMVSIVSSLASRNDRKVSGRKNAVFVPNVFLFQRKWPLICLR